MTNGMPELDLKVGDEVLARRGYGVNSWVAQEYVKGVVTDVYRVYVRVEFPDGPQWRNGKYRRDNGSAERNSQGGYITTQARVDWRKTMEDAHKAVSDAGFERNARRASDGLMLAVAEFLRGVDKDGTPLG